MLSDIFRNPELKRNAWLELKPNRILAMLGLIALAFILATTSLFDNDYLKSEEVLMNTALFILYLITGVWGSKNAADAVADEINQKTWDRQRMSGQSPLSLTIGKIFGPTLLQWLGGLSAMLVYFCAALVSENVGQSFINGLIYIALVLLMNLSALLFSLLTITGSTQSAFSHSKINTTLFFILSVIGVGWISFYLALIGEEKGAISWYGLIWNNLTILISLLIFIGWSGIGIHQNLRKELQYRNTQNYWLAFLVFTGFYFYGITWNFPIYTEDYSNTTYIAPQIYGLNAVYYHLALVSLVFFLLTQFLLLFERPSENDYTLFLQALRKGQFKKAWQNAPLWFSVVLGLTLSLLLLFALQIAGLVKHQLPLIFRQLEVLQFQHNFAWSYLAMVFLVLRDIFMTRTLLYRSKYKNKLLSLALYYSLIYWAIPLLFMIGAHQKVTAENYFLPFFRAVGWFSPVVLAGQALVAWGLHRRWLRA
ncbi:MAG: hypothetical protein RL331_1825 [Bacteroidota bacterium]|jgi:hypothetical protein